MTTLGPVLIERAWLRLTRLVWLSAEMRVPIRVRLSAVMIVTFSAGVEHVSPPCTLE